MLTLTRGEGENMKIICYKCRGVIRFIPNVMNFRKIKLLCEDCLSDKPKGGRVIRLPLEKKKRKYQNLQKKINSNLNSRVLNTCLS